MQLLQKIIISKQVFINFIISILTCIGWHHDWTGSVACEVPDAVCNIDRVLASELTKERFENEYKNKKPLIIHG